VFSYARWSLLLLSGIVAMMGDTRTSLSQTSEDYSSNGVIQAAVASVRQCLAPLVKRAEAVSDADELAESLLQVLDFQPMQRHRFLLPAKPNIAKLNSDRIAKLFDSPESFSHFRGALTQLAEAIEQTADESESRQNLNLGYRLRWQAAGLRALIPTPTPRGHSPHSWAHSASIGTMQHTPKVFTNHPKTLWPAGTYSMVATPHFEVASQAGVKPTEEIADVCEQTYAVWRQLFFRYWADDQVLAPEYLRQRESKFSVAVFRDKAAYIKALRSTERNIGISTGYYDPNRKISFFYWDGNKTFSTVVHELTHQLFFELSERDVGLDTDKGAGFWAVEGAALYLESMSTKTVGGCTLVDVGGWDAARLQASRYRRLYDQYWIPWDRFHTVSGSGFRQGDDVPAMYSQATGLTHFWMDGSVEQRTAFERYIASVYGGKEDAMLLGEFNDDAKLRESYDRYLMLSPGSNPIRTYFANRKEVVLSRCQVTNEQLLGWPIAFRSSPWLDLAFTEIDDSLFLDGVSHREPAWSIVRLNLESTQVTDRALPAIAKMKDLSELDLSNCKITDSGLEVLRGHKTLKTLWLNQCGVSDKSIDVFLSVPQLERVHLLGSSITVNGWNRLLRERPRLKTNSTGPKPN
jgi:hypothetical protein